jgi:hypothetical protein
MICMKAKNIPITGDFWLSLVFKAEAELVKLCQELQIKIPK